jgi:N-acyl-D-glutamate deacylase
MKNTAYDLVINNGHIVDPDSGWDGLGSVAIKDGIILAVSKDPLEGIKVIDATGQYIAPGFIDMHSHSVIQKSSCWMQAFDGVTTALELEIGMLPVNASYEMYAKQGGRPINYGFSSSALFARVAALESEPPEPDVNWFLGMLSKPDWQLDLANDEQLKKILDLIEQGLKEGAMGIGCNFGFTPVVGRKEFYKIAELAKKYNVPIFIHARYFSSQEPESSFEAIEEAIGLSFNPGVHLQICHLNSSSLRDIDDICELITKAIENGASISVESYPYGSLSAPIGIQYLRQKNWQSRMGNINASDIEYLGKPLNDDSMTAMQKDQPGNMIICHFLRPENSQADEELLAKSNLFPNSAIASDSEPFQMISTGQLINDSVWPVPEGAYAHPRSSGNFSRFIKMYVKDQKKISLMEAIRKVSLIPAQTLEKSTPQMASKGRLKVGADADIVVFDLDKVEDKSTFANPHLTSAGMTHVIVNGTQIIDSGNLDTSLFPGKPIRRSVSS